MICPHCGSRKQSDSVLATALEGWVVMDRGGCLSRVGAGHWGRVDLRCGARGGVALDLRGGLASARPDVVVQGL